MDKKGYFYDPETRFSSRAEIYTKYRLSYPPEIIDFLTNAELLSKNIIVADIGFGTGILSQNLKKISC